MKVFIIGLVVLMGTACMAGSLADKPTVELGYESQNASNVFASAQATYLNASVEIPAGIGSAMVAIKL